MATLDVEVGEVDLFITIELRNTSVNYTFPQTGVTEARVVPQIVI